MVFVIFGLGSCIDTIMIDLPEGTSIDPVIEGYIEMDPNYYFIWGNISRTQHVGESLAVFPPSNVDIKLIHNGKAILSLQPARILKIPKTTFNNDYGVDSTTSTFQLMATIDNESYISETQKLIPVPAPDSLSLELVERTELNLNENLITTEYVRLLIHSPLTNIHGQKVSMQWDVSGVYEFRENTSNPNNPFFEPKACYVETDQRFDQVVLVNANEINGLRIAYFEIREEPADFRFSTGFYFTAVQKSLSQDAVQYWDEISQSNQRSGNIYDVLPGQVRTNFVNELNPNKKVRGYFYTSQVDTIRVYASPEQTGRQRRICRSSSESRCFNCLLIRNSSDIKPFYWK